MIIDMVTTFLAAAAGIIAYRAILLPIEVEAALDRYESETDVATPQQQSQDMWKQENYLGRNDLLELAIQHNAATTETLLDLVSILAINTAGAEKAAKFASRTRAAATAEQAESARQEPDLEGFPSFDSPGQDARQSYLAEALAQIETPDGGRLVDP